MLFIYRMEKYLSEQTDCQFVKTLNCSICRFLAFSHVSTLFLSLFLNATAVFARKQIK